MKAIAILNAFLISGSLAHAAPQVWDLDRGDGSVAVNAIGKPSMLKIKGKGPAPKGKISIEGSRATGTLTFDLRKIETGIKLRDRHLREKYLEVEKHPEAKLTITQLALPSGFAKPDFLAKDLPFEGMLLLHGVEKPVSGTVDVTRKGPTASAVAAFGIKIGDFGIKTPSFAGVTVTENVKVEVDASAPLADGASK